MTPDDELKVLREFIKPHIEWLKRPIAPGRMFNATPHEAVLIASMLERSLALASRLAVAGQWRPIAEAPDDTRVLVYCPVPNSPDTLVTVLQCHRDRWIYGSGLPTAIQPTYFMPLPSPPQPEQQQHSGGRDRDGSESDVGRGHRRVVCAANRFDGVLILGVRHWDPLMHAAARRAFLDHDDHRREWEQGFIDQRGEFLTREEAWKIAEAAGQIIRRVGGDTINGGHLFSENLY